jgi:dihydroorotate dehydrogenase
MTASMYSFIRPLLFKLEPERAHALALSALNAAERLSLLSRPIHPSESALFMGLRFPNRVGLAAGFDKNGRYLGALGALGFGFIEIGTVTPRPQPGRPRPRLFRLPRHRALINRMGFPNEGSAAIGRRLSQGTFAGIVGINIGKNAATPLPRAVDDYVDCYRAVAPHADYVAVNVSSPNTDGLRNLQRIEHLEPILAALCEERERMRAAHGRILPLLAKISPDLDDGELMSVAHLLMQLKIEGVIATNTTLTRPEAVRSQDREMSLLSEEGGLSGLPLHEKALHAVRVLRSASQDRLTIIGTGGIASAAGALAMLQAGVDLLQIYTGLIYQGPGLVKQLRAAIV